MRAEKDPKGPQSDLQRWEIGSDFQIEEKPDDNQIQKNRYQDDHMKQK